MQPVQFAVDGGRRRVFRLPGSDVIAETIRRYGQRLVPCEECPDMLQVGAQLRQTFTAVDLVLAL